MEYQQSRPTWYHLHLHLFRVYCHLVGWGHWFNQVWYTTIMVIKAPSQSFKSLRWTFETIVDDKSGFKSLGVGLHSHKYPLNVMNHYIHHYVKLSRYTEGIHWRLTKQSNYAVTQHNAPTILSWQTNYTIPVWSFLLWVSSEHLYQNLL